MANLLNLSDMIGHVKRRNALPAAFFPFPAAPFPWANVLRKTAESDNINIHQSDSRRTSRHGEEVSAPHPGTPRGVSRRQRPAGGLPGAEADGRPPGRRISEPRDLCPAGGRGTEPPAVPAHEGPYAGRDTLAPGGVHPRQRLHAAEPGPDGAGAVRLRQAGLGRGQRGIPAQRHRPLPGPGGGRQDRHALPAPPQRGISHRPG